MVDRGTDVALGVHWIPGGSRRGHIRLHADPSPPLSEAALCCSGTCTQLGLPDLWASGAAHTDKGQGMETKYDIFSDSDAKPCELTRRQRTVRPARRRHPLPARHHATCLCSQLNKYPRLRGRATQRLTHTMGRLQLVVLGLACCWAVASAAKGSQELWGLGRGAIDSVPSQLGPVLEDERGKKEAPPLRKEEVCKGLIRRAISQSGVALSSWVIQKNPLFWAKKLAEKVGCPVEDTARMAKCLKVTDPRALTLAYKMPLAGMEYPMLHYLGFLPVIDGDFIPDDPVNLYANAADIDYIAGTNNMDGHIFASIDMPAINKDKQEVTEEDFFRLVSGLTITKGLRGAKTTFDVYTESWAQDPSQENKKKTVVDFETDILFLVPTEIALAQHRANAKSAKTYTYLFSHPSRMPTYPKWVGADHADDIQYVFGKPFATPLGYRPQDRTVSKNMIAYWTNFAKTGDPNMGNSAVPTHWDPYTTENGSYLEITKKIDSNSMKRGLRTNFLRYWTLSYLALPTVTDQGATPAPPAGDPEATPVPPTGDSEAAPVPPTGDSEAAPVPPTGDSEAAPVPPTGDSEAAPVPPTGDSEAAPVPPSGDSEAAPVPPTGDSEAIPVPPTGDSEAAPVPPTDDSKGVQMPAVIGF
ncbi:bile salt-activated lipase [Cebus imitator]|uniref:bile salt-activated lipase n=1 Tax=Cebus imitator TaxID=2715852 RepID=UPI00189A1A8A|nr:bile salt-activated lipase [Cebus imitator]